MPYEQRAKKPVFEPSHANFVLSFDPAVPSSFSSGWDGEQQEHCARFDARDWVAFFGRERWMKYVPHLSSLPTRLVLNIMTGSVCWQSVDEVWLDRLIASGCCGSLNDYIEYAKYASNASKLRQEGSHWTDTEMVGLVGCKYPDRDTESTLSDKLRERAPVERELSDAVKSAYMSMADRQQFRPKESVKLDEFVGELEWQTDGGASMTGLDTPAVEVEGEGAIAKLRLTKSAIVYSTTAEEVTESVRRALESRSAVVKAIIKLGETQKDRLIFPYPLYSTIAKMWLLSFADTEKNYPLGAAVRTLWPWSNSLGFEGEREMRRHFETWALVDPVGASEFYAKNLLLWGAVFGDYTPSPHLFENRVTCVTAADVKEFDFQVGEWFADEFWASVRKCVPAEAEANVPKAGNPFQEHILPLDKLADYNSLHDRKGVELSGDQDLLLARCQHLVVPNLSMLLSGTPETSKVGNRANFIANSVAAEICDTISPGCVILYEVRGDDQVSAVTGKTTKQAMALAAVWWMVVNNFFLLGPDKTRVSWGRRRNTEFLRLDYSGGGVRGYALRALVWYCEKRPLSAERISVKGDKVAGMLQQAMTVCRRGGDERLIEFANFCADRAVDRGAAYFSAPTGTGGVGLGVTAPYVVDFSAKLKTKMVNPKLEWAATKVAKTYAEFSLTADEAMDIAREQADALSASAEGKQMYQARRESVMSLSMLKVANVELPRAEEVTSLPAWLFGSVPSCSVRVDLAKKVARLRGTTIRSVIEPELFNLLVKVEKRLKLPRRLSSDWLSGTIPANVSVAHPLLRPSATVLAAKFISNTRPFWDSHTSYYHLSRCVQHFESQLQRDMEPLLRW